MSRLSDLVCYLDNSLSIHDVPDFEGAHNGIQIEGGKKVSRIGSSVDFSLSVIKKCVEKEIDFLLVHHGLFWNGIQPISGKFREILEICFSSKLSVYSAHLPLDIHPSFGNNILLAKQIGMKNPQSALPWRSVHLGLKEEMHLSLSSLLKSLKSCGCDHFTGGAFYAGSVGKVAVSTGSAGSHIIQAHEEGINTFITGEGSHWNVVFAENVGMNLIFAGHYETEIFGVDALGKHLSKHFKLSYDFISSKVGWKLPNKD